MTYVEITGLALLAIVSLAISTAAVYLFGLVARAIGLI